MTSGQAAREIVDAGTEAEQLANRVVTALRGHVYRFTHERDLQDGMEMVLCRSGFRVEREFRLSAQDRPDFLIDGCVAIEVKMRASGSAVLAQLLRYAAHSRVSALVVATPRLSSVAGIPAVIVGVPVRVVALPGPGLSR